MLRKIFDFFLIILISIYIIFEELIWEKISKPIINKILKLNLFLNLVSKIESLNSYIILSIFLIFFTIVELLGVYAAIIFVQGKVISAIFIYLLKIPLAILILWFFDITKPKLLKFRWFEIVYDNLIYLKNKIQHSKIYLMIYEKIDNIKEYINSKFDFSKHSIKNRVIELYQKLKKKFQK
ncbi:putative membrane protein [Aliarcobacter faecis]|uniref:hypothetical protein n=1 Tax=Aliarcobacter faecis TaxID=1564138 RepID=UPI00047B3EE5|nr:hypothetical protein [Aliarcobacter faecis]QKF72493.1 putative membrane protein [Aliarcobacter faecis]